MAGRMDITYPGAGATLYAIVRRDSDGKVWDGDSFETWSNAAIATYDIPLVDQGGDLYAADFPTAITAGLYRIFYYEMASAAPATTDLLLATEEHRQGHGTGTPPGGDVDVWGTRAGTEQKVGVINLATYANLEAEDQDTEPGLTNIEDAIEDDLIEAATDMAVAWREFTATALGFESAYEERWLADTNEYGAAVKAYNGRNVQSGQNEPIPEQIATCLQEWQRRLEMLRTGTVLLDYQDETGVDEEDDEAGMFQNVAMNWTPEDTSDEDSG